MSPRGLGRGLSALIPGAPVSEPVLHTPAPISSATLVVALERIHANPLQPRQTFVPEELEQLAASLRTHGVLQPLVVTVRTDGEYELIAGERRLRAAKLAGLTAVPVVVRDGAMDDRTKLELALIENIQRQDLNPIERALAYRQLQEEFGLTQEDVAARVGVSRSAVTHALRILALPADMQDAVRSGTISEGHAKVLAGISDAREQRAWFDRIQEQHLPVAAIAAARQQSVHHVRPSSGSQTRDPNLRAKELALQQRLGAKVRIVAETTGGGSIAITYSDPEELQGILRTILH
ncbi:MAG: ParB/RepB/Spo0J family partition protein [bacterium]|nr:ParB/RepB/Spo0J family partition protein [bacterium]